MKNITEWEHFKKNYLWVSLFMIVMGFLGIFTAEFFWLKVGISSFFWLITLVIVIGNRISYRKKW